MANLTVQDISRTGLNPTLSAATAGGDEFTQTNPNVFLYVKNDDASAKQVTVTAANTSKEVANWGELSASNSVTSVPAGEFRLIGPFPLGPFEKYPQISYDAVTSLTIGAIRLKV